MLKKMKLQIGPAFLAVVFAVAFSFALSPVSFAQQKKVDDILFMMDWTPQGKYAPFYAAVDKGFYAEKQLEVKIIRGYGGADTVTAIDQGRAPFGISDIGPVILNRDKGGQVKAVGMLSDLNPLGYAVLKESGILKPKDLEGRTMGGTPFDAGMKMLPVFLNKNGVDINKLKIITISGDLYIPSLIQKKVDAVGAWENSLLIVAQKFAKKEGKELTWMGFRDYGLDIYSVSLLTTDKLIKGNPDLVKRFVHSTYKGVEFMVKKPAEAVDIVMKYHNELDREIIMGQVEKTVFGIMSPAAMEKGYGWMTDEKMKKTIDVVRESYQIEKDIPLSEIYTNEFLPGKK